MNQRRRFFLGAVVVGTCLAFGLGGEAAGQTPAAPAKPAAAKLKVKAITASAKLKKALAGKPPYAEAKVKAALSYNAKGFPQLTLAKSKRKVTVERVDVAETQPDKALLTASTVLDPQLKSYQTYITSPYLRYEKPTNLMAIPETVSHLSRQTGVKDQGDRNTCVAHAAAAGIESWYSWKNNASRDLSEQHAFEVFMAKEGRKSCEDRGLETWRAAGYLTSNRICSNWAYSGAVPSCDLAVPATCSSAATHGHTSTQVIFSTAFGGTGTMVAENTNYLESILAGGNDIVFGVYLAGGDWGDATIDTGVVDVEMWGTNPAPAWGGHAMLLVGYDRPNNYFVFKNSWGAGSGHAGYAHVSYEYVQTYAKYAYYIKGATTP